MLTNNDITNFNHLSNFTSLKDFNNNCEMWLADHKNEFTKKEYIVLRRLTKFSAKVYGVSNISIRRLVQAVEQHDKVNVSETTFHRMKRKAIKLGMLEVLATKRTDNSQSSNIYVFQEYQVVVNDEKKTENVTPSKSKKHDETLIRQQKGKREMTSHEADKNYKTNMNKDNRKQGHIRHTLDHTFISSNIPDALVKAIKPFFPFADDIYAIYKRLSIATKDVPHTLFTNIDDYVSVFKQTVYRLKRGLVRGDYLGYLYGAFKNKANEFKHIYSHPDDSIYFDWVNS